MRTRAHGNGPETTLLPEIDKTLETLRSRRTSADGGAVLCLLGAGLLLAFAPASRDITRARAIPTPDGPAPLVAALAPLAGGEPDSGPDAQPADVVIQRTWDNGRPASPAVISWWDEERWTDVEREQAAWRAEWVREARRHPENVPLELWPQIVEWAPYDRSIERSARAALGSRDSIRRYADRLRESRLRDARSVRPGDRVRVRNGDDGRTIRVDERSAEQIRRWARDALRELRERAEDRSRRSSRRPPGQPDH